MIKNTFNIVPTLTHGQTGQFEASVNGERIVERGGNWFTRRFGAGYPDLDRVIDLIRPHT